MEKPELSIITLNYNGFNDTVQMIESFKTYMSIPYEMIVVDNGSVENEAGMLKNQFPDIKVIRSETNLGFAGGNNLGIMEVSAEFLLLINNDTFVSDNSITLLIDRMEKNPSLGGLSPKILFADSKRLIQFAGYTPLSTITLRNRLIGFKERDIGQYDHPNSTPYLHGAAMLVRREVIEKAGVMPEIYFLYYEELDWSLHLRRAGFQLEYNPSATVYHKESSSVGQNSPLRAFYMTRNRMLFARRNLTPFYRLLSIGYQILIVLPKNVIVVLLAGRSDLAMAMIKGCMAFVKLKKP